MSILNESLATRISDWAPQTEKTTDTIAPQDGQSYVRGPSTPPLAYITIPQLLRDAVSRFGPRDAVVFSEQNIRLSYYDLDRAVDELASGLLALGLEKGDLEKDEEAQGTMRTLGQNMAWLLTKTVT